MSCFHLLDPDYIIQAQIGKYHFKFQIWAKKQPLKDTKTENFKLFKNMMSTSNNAILLFKDPQDVAIAHLSSTILILMFLARNLLLESVGLSTTFRAWTLLRYQSLDFWPLLSNII